MVQKTGGVPRAPSANPNLKIFFKIKMDPASIKQRLTTKIYKLVQNPKKGLKSNVWETIKCIVDENEKLIEDFVGCEKCGAVLTYKSSSTKNLNDHRSKFCKMDDKDKHKQVFVGSILLT